MAETEMVTVESLLEQAKTLSPADQARLIADLAGVVSQKLQAREPAQPGRSLYGIWAKYGPAPSAEEIDEARREMWGEYAEGGC